MKKILVTGACGYIGSHTMIDLIEKGFEVVAVDSLINGDPRALENVYKVTGKRVENYPIDLCDQKACRSIFEKEKNITGIIHFAALKAVGESTEQPIRYFRNNLNSLINVLDNCLEFDVKHFLFSSSCTVYGLADHLPVTEQTPEKPAESPYGRTKQMGEKLIQDCLKNSSVSSISLRYFNPAGAHPSGLIGESPINTAQNLVPVITETAIGTRKSMKIYGKDYPTRDGTCIRDYIHIMDLADAHTKALEYLIDGKNEEEYEVFNLGIGQGVSVLEAIQAFEKVSGKKLNYELTNNRSGDVIAIYADYSKAKKYLGWSPKYGIEDIMRTAWLWEQNRQSDTFNN